MEDGEGQSMLRTIFVGVAIGLVTLWLWEKWQRSAAGGDGQSILARITRMWSAPTRRERTMPVNVSVASFEGKAGTGCSCS